jgi:hypothetical protein
MREHRDERLNGDGGKTIADYITKQDIRQRRGIEPKGERIFNRSEEWGTASAV